MSGRLAALVGAFFVLGQGKRRVATVVFTV